MKIYFITGSQFLYGEETLKQVESDSIKMVEYINAKIPRVDVIYKGMVKTEKEATQFVKEVNYDDDCVGMMVWCHTFSPAKMWINGMKNLQKPMLHLHTQFNRELPYDEIDMDFMNLNQSAHGDREFAYVLTRLGVPRVSVAGYYKDEDVIKEIGEWAAVAVAVDYSKKLKVCRFGDNMREVAVTDGDKVEAQIKLGWQVDYYGIGDIVQEINKVTEEEIEELYKEIISLYELNTDLVESVKEQVKYEIALKRFLAKNDYKALTTNFQDLHGLKQLFGMSIQRLMAEGYGFGAEGDWKIAALSGIFKKMAEGRKGVTCFMEDYTYDLVKGKELVLGSHMLEVCPTVASTKPTIEVHPLGIGDREPPARLVFDGTEGDGIAVCMVDMGDRFRLICAEIELVKQPKPMPKLPVARIMWKLKPDFKTGAKAWLEAGGAHHTVVSTALTAKDMELFAKLNGLEFVHIK
ncbi:MAG: L-arabinose isomerase [Clostridia bacterium]|nr:L-arabinose isomerase [Clostridia bacterium]